MGKDQEPDAFALSLVEGCESVVLQLFFWGVKSARKRPGFFDFYKDLCAFLGVVEICDRRFWAKNNGAIVEGCHMGVFLERFSRFLGDFSQKVARNLQKSKEIEQFLAILKKARSLSR